MRTSLEPLGWALVRAPLLPVDVYLASGAGRSGPAVDDPWFAAALAVASPSLARQVGATAAGRPSTDERVSGKLLRYLIRMSTRPTPFGMFAGVGLAPLGDRTDLRLGSAPPTTRTRPDMAWLLAFVAELEARPEVRRQVRVSTNPAAWISGGRALLPSRLALDGLGEGGPVDIRATSAVLRTLDMAQRPVRWGELCEALSTVPGATPEKVDALLTELWTQTYLLTELRPSLLDTEPARRLLDVLSAVPAAREASAALARLLDDMAAWDASPVSVRADGVRQLTASAREIVADFDDVTVQVDTALALEGTVGTPLARAVARAATVLLRLSPPTWNDLEAYRQAFVNRYGADREVPLLELLDAERGLGPPSPASPPGGSSADAAARRHAVLRRIAVDALRDRRRVVDLTGEVESLATDDVGLAPPLSLDLSVFVLAPSGRAVDDPHVRLMIGPNLGAQSAGRNLSRFAGLLGGPALDALRAVAAAERAGAPRARHVELTYLPRNARSANVLVRANVRDGEVVMSTSARADADVSIRMADIVIGVRGHRFYARWISDDADLHVHATHMLTPRAAPVECRFLEDVTRAGRRAIAPFGWGSCDDLPYLPRVEVHGVVLAPARWRIDGVLRDELAPRAPDFGERLRRWRADWLVPRYVYLTVGDNRLLLDLDEPAQVEELQTELRGLDDGRVVVIQEGLPGPEHAWLEGPEGRHLPEIVVPLRSRVPTEDPVIGPRARSRAQPTTARDRLRPPGSDWLYAKVYGPRSRQDELLLGPIRQLADLVTGSGFADRWWFVRYADPETHLRVRFHGDPRALLEDVLPRVCELGRAVLEGGACTRLAFDTYEREVDRYGGVEGMHLAETAFGVDSITVVQLLPSVTGAPLAARTMLAVLSTDRLLEDVGLDEARRAALYRRQVVARHEAGPTYRALKGELRSWLADPALAEVPAAMAEPLRTRRRALAATAERFRALERAGELTRSLDDVGGALAHMHWNRLLGTGPPAEQLVLGLASRATDGLLRSPRSPRG